MRLGGPVRCYSLSRRPNLLKMLASTLSENLSNGKGVEVRLRFLRDELGAGKAEGLIRPQEK